MLIMNQNKTSIINLDRVSALRVEPSGENESSAVLVDWKTQDYRIETIGTYKSESRAKEVLMELFFIYGAAQYVLNARKTSYANVRDIYEMPDK